MQTNLIGGEMIYFLKSQKLSIVTAILSLFISVTATAQESDFYAAIAYSNTTGSWGYCAEGHATTREMAEQCALPACTESMATNP